MNLEHVGYNVADPDAMAAWYVRNLGLRIVRESHSPNPCYFLADGRGMMIEIYRNPAAPLLDSRSMPALTLHLALWCDDVAAARSRLLSAGATPDGELSRSEGIELAMVRDPWGLMLQLIRRDEPLV